MKKLFAVTVLLLAPLFTQAVEIPTTTTGALTQLENTLPASTTITGYVDSALVYLKTNAPAVLGVASSTYAKIEVFRIAQSVALSAHGAKILAEISAAGVVASHPALPGSPTPPSTSYKTVGKQLEYLAFVALAFVFAHPWLFYPIAAILLWWVGRKIINLISMVFRSRRDYD